MASSRASNERSGRMLILSLLVVLAIVAIALAYLNAGGLAWTALLVAWTEAAWITGALPHAVVVALATAFAAAAVLLNVVPLRRALVSGPLLGLFRKALPPMSQTEREALEAGSVWWDGELFSGKPDWRALLDVPAATLTAEEQRFLDNECETLCGMVTDWETTNVYKDLPPPVWQYIKDKGFLGMIIPKEYGGLGFSAYAHSQVVTRLSTRSGTVAVTVLVPNSLG